MTIFTTTLTTISIAALISAVATRVVMRYAQKRLVDQVNQRSSHRIATPRGGGLGLVIGLLAAWLPMVWFLGASPLVVPLTIAVVGMSALGWWDDHGHVSAAIRLPLQLTLVGVVCITLGVPDRLALVSWYSLSAVAWWYFPVAILGGGWMVNLTNFMDGIDGIAATQGVVGCVTLALLLPTEAITVANTADAAAAMELRLFLFACAAACLGFLVWNRPPAKIFMGDVGSTALGMVFVSGILSGIHYGVALDVLLLPLAPFIADATCTLVRRAWNRERLSQAHRSHLYQRLAKRWSVHLPATSLYAALAVLGAAFSLATHHGWMPSMLGLTLWLAVWIGLVMYGRRVCPVNAE
jgi:Fuc2NAc and GlcNAc transferase